MPIVSWGHYVELLEKLEIHILLELKALYEDAWKVGEFMAFSQQLVIQVTLELHALLKFTPKAYQKLKVILTDVQQQHKPIWILGGTSVVP